MTRDEIRSAIVEQIGSIAPETDALQVPEDADLRQALDLDSMDIFNLVVALSQRFEIEIPDADAARLVTLGGGTDYLERRLSGI
jgi:acyl carrier protein